MKSLEIYTLGSRSHPPSASVEKYSLIFFRLSTLFIISTLSSSLRHLLPSLDVQVERPQVFVFQGQCARPVEGIVSYIIQDYWDRVIFKVFKFISFAILCVFRHVTAKSRLSDLVSQYLSQ